MAGHFVIGYTSSLRVIHASRSHSPASEKEQTTHDTFGRILKESFRQLDLFGASSRTSQDTLVLDSPKFTEAYEIWVTKLRLACLQRRRSARLTREKDCSSWPTVQIADSKQCKFNKRGNPHLGKVAGAWATSEARNQEGYQIVNGKKVPRLAQQANWPTPNVPNRGKELSKKHRPKSGGIDLQSAVRPTPTERDHKNPSPTDLNRHSPSLLAVGLPDPDSPSTNGKSRGLWITPTTDDTKRRKGKYKQGGMALNTQTKGRLNPDWVEQLMGLPVGWTDLGLGF